MIKVSSPWGAVGLGNHFFMYTFVRILAKNLNYRLYTPEISFSERKPGHPTLNYKFDDLDGLDMSNNGEFYFDDSFMSRFRDIDEISEYLKNKNCSLINHGYHQNYNYWKNYKNEVKEFFTFFRTNETKGNDEVAIHLRNSHQDPRFLLPEQYYIKSISKMKVKKVNLFADNFTRHENLIKKIQKIKKIDCQIVDLNVPDSLREIGKFKKIICSQGSFSFWASFLSNAEHIIWPITNQGPNKPNASHDINYIVDDEDRYEFVKIK